MIAFKCRFLLVIALSMLSSVLFAQNFSVSGVVTDASGEPLMGATVAVLNSEPPKGVMTDLDGNFNITVPGNSLIEVSYIGFVSQTFQIQSSQKLNVIMEEDANLLDELVVVGFGTQKKESVVGAITAVKAKELQAPVRSLSNSIGGRVAGILAVQRSGEPGKDDASFWIRGISTFTGDQNPLILVDGIERPMNNVDPLEIESFSVLKDASATAVYGVRGANGVILITTKRGFEGKAKVDARYEHGFSWATQRPEYLNAYQRSFLFNEAIDANPSASQAMKYTEAELVAMRDGTDLELFPNVDWQDVLMKDVTQNEKLSVNISGGGKNVKYYTALSVYNQEGQYAINNSDYNWVPSTLGAYGRNVNYTRYNFRSNIDADLGKYTVVSLGLQATVANNMEPSEGSDNIYLWINNVAPNAFPVLYKDGSFPGRDGLYNPYVQLTQRGFKQTTTNELRANISINQDLSFITEGLRAVVRYAYDAENYNNAIRQRELTLYQAQGRDENGDIEYKVIDANKQEEYLNYSSSAWGQRNQYFESSINYDKTFGKHAVSGLVLYYMKDNRNITASSYINSLPSRSLGLAARVTYAYDKKYLFEANLGYNGSENFPAGQRMGVFPAFAAGWVVSQEDFLKKNPVLTWLKIRASYGQVGSDQIGSTRFAYLSTLKDANGANGFGIKFDQYTGGIAEDQLAAQNLTWEKASKYNIGIEIGLWDSWTTTLEGFYEYRNNIFIQPQVSEIAGLLNPAFANTGSMDNRGFEITTEYNKVFDNGLVLTARGNYTFARNKYIDDGKTYSNYWQDVAGVRYGERLLYKAMNLFSQEEIDALPDYYRQFSLTKDQLRAGDIRYEDVNDDGKITEDDRVWTSSPSIPESMLGFGASLAYKGFDFSFLFQGAFGASTYLTSGWYFQPFQADRDPKYMGNVLTNFLDRWTEDNQNPYAFSPRLYMGQNTNNYVSSTWWVRKSNYLRLKNLELGYTLPRKTLDRMNIENLRFYVSAQNLFTFSEFARNFWDPEVSADSYPIQATVFFGVNLTF
jgi:TonB-linked SusC/RagA family outer membrane protein